MFRNETSLAKALIEMVKFHEAKTKDITIWKEFISTDKNCQYLSRLFQYYFKALKTAEKYGYNGVGCITFADQRIIRYQRLVASKLSPVK